MGDMLHRRLFLGSGLALLAVGCDRARGTGTGIYAISDPNEFAETLARRIASEGMLPIRETFSQFGQATVDQATMEGTFALFERAIAGKQARSWDEIEDIGLRDRTRTIYYLHVFDERTVLFTRFDFIRSSAQTWSLIGLTFGSQWNQIVVPTTPGFASQN